MVKVLPTLLHKLLLILLITVSSGVFILTALTTSVLAQSADPETESVTVSATVPFNEPPSTPILISPANNSYIAVNKPTFIWQASTDSDGHIDHYQLSLDGTPYFDNIPTTNTDNADYTLTYNASTQRYTLVVKAALSEGLHTWKIRATDNYTKGTDSATWSFTIDTQAPAFVLTQIGDVATSISNQDASTIPSEPIEVGVNEPQLLGNGEINSTVVLTVVIPGQSNQTFTNTTDINGNWGEQLGILPRGETITLNFTITDQAGNVSFLTGVQFFIKELVIIFPPASPSPSPSPISSPGPSPSPSGTPIPGASPSPIPSIPPRRPSPTPSPFISIPYTPPREVISEALREAAEAPPIQALIASIPEALTKTLKAAAPFSAIVVASAMPLITLASLATQFGSRFSIQLLFRLLQALGLLPGGKPQGFVYDSKTHQGVAFALITITRAETKTTVGGFLETVVTDVNGVYRNLSLPPGDYRLVVAHQEYFFPTVQPRPNYLISRDFYRGEVFTVSDQKESIYFMIPLDPIKESSKSTWKHYFRIWLNRLSRYSLTLSMFLLLPTFLLTGVLTILYPTVWNYLILAFYTLSLGIKSISWFRIPTITGKVIDTLGKPIPFAIIRLIDLANNDLTSVLSSDDEGNFHAFVPKKQYQLNVVKPGYIWSENGGMGNMYIIDATKEPKHVIVTLEKLQNA